MLKFDILLTKKLRKYLDVFCYDTLNQKLRQHHQYFFDPLPKEYDKIKQSLLLLEKKKKILIQLLLLGDSVQYEDAESALGIDFLNVLIELGIVLRNGAFVQTDSYLIVSFLDKYFLIGIPYMSPNCRIKDPVVYMGMDTYRLTENITSKRVGKVLDLCAGSGIQGICAANKAEQVVLVELNKQTIPFTRFNIYLNNVEDTVEIRQGDLYKPIFQDKFDEIYANPPFIAVPTTWNFPMAGDGGEDGLGVVTRIIKGYREHLNEEGVAIMVGEAIGSDKEPHLMHCVRKELSEEFKVTMILDVKLTIEAYLRRCAGVALGMGKITGYTTDELFQEYKSWCKDVNATAVYNYYLKVEKVAHGAGSIDVINMTNTWSKWDSPFMIRKSEYQIQKLPQYYSIINNNKVIAQFDETVLAFLNIADGSLTIEDIYERMCQENPEIVRYASKIEAIQSLAESCGILSLRGIVGKSENTIGS